MGQNIGTCITALLASIGANKTAKRASVIHFLFNTIGAIVFGTLMYVVFRLNPVFANSRISSTDISIFHTIFNLANTLLLLPASKLLIKISGLIVREEEVDEKEVEGLDKDVESALRHMDDRILESPSFAISTAMEEALHMGQVTYNNTKLAMEALIESDSEKADQVFEKEKVIDAQEKMITEYLIKISNLSLTEEQNLVVNNMFHVINNIERVGDHADNLAELAVEKINKNIKLSDKAYGELKNICNTTLSAFENA